MRDKEAIETERKNISRNLEKQAKAVERLVETEKNLANQAVSILSKFLARFADYLNAYLGRLGEGADLVEKISRDAQG
jgi:E3 ubiquitin-protein ligase BRE1